GIAGATIVEGHVGRRLMTFVLTLSAPSAAPVTIRWNTVNGTATAGRDYVAGGGTVTFAPGQTRRTIAVAVSGDRIAEADETFRVNLSSPLNATLSATAGVATGTIRNDDGPIRRAAAFAALAASATTPASNQARRRS
ncbi:MAG: Calx-beta domain-containing protein, partial [Planctomycetia bacterium]